MDDLLKVENPERLVEDDLNDPKLADVLTNSAVGEFTDVFADPFIWRGSMLTDEQITGINWEETARINQRIIRYDDGPSNTMFGQISRARAIADTAASKLRELLEDPESDIRVATALNYAGYSYILMGDAMCEATINVGATIYGPVELYGMAVTRFEDALAVARAAGDSDMENLALVGLARAHLNAGNYADAMAAAEQVASDFEWWVEYDNQDANNNPMYGRVTGQNHNLGVHPRFLNGAYLDSIADAQQADPRIQHFAESRRGHNQLSELYTPYQPWSYSEFTDTPLAEGGEPVLFARDTDIKMASYLEAVHHYYEAAGRDAGDFDPDAVTGPEGTLREFVNARRAFGRQGAFTGTTSAQWRAELKEQRARDLYLGGFRLGDLRRWGRLSEADADHVFPSGAHPTAEWGNYGDAQCFVIPKEEYQGNPNIQNPHG